MAATRLTEKMTALLVGALTRSLRTPDGGTVYQVDTHRTARTVSALQRRGLVVMEARTVIADDDGREYERVTSWLTEEGARVARRLAGEAQQEDDSDLITRKPTAYMVELLRKGAADAEGRMTVADHNDRTQDGLLRRGMADVVSAGLWVSYLVITERGRAYLSRVDGAQQERVRPVAPVRKAGPFAGALVEMARREGVVAPVRVRGPFAGALDAIAAREAVSAPVAAQERAEVPEVPLSAVPRSLADAAAFLGSLKVGERVRVTREGRTADLTVSMGPRRADGAFGSVGSTRVTVSYGVGRYSFEVSAGDLFANVDGDKATWSRGGVRMMRVPVEQQEERELNIVVTTRVVSARAEECRFAGEEGHNAEGTGPECDGECVSLDGDVRELSSPEESVITADADDLEAFEGDAVAWAVDFIRTKTDAAQPSSSPIGDAVRECEWLSGDYADPYEGDARVTEVSVRLTGDWSEEERARVFVGVVRG